MRTNLDIAALEDEIAIILDAIEDVRCVSQRIVSRARTADEADDVRQLLHARRRQPIAQARQGEGEKCLGLRAVQRCVGRARGALVFLE